MITSAHTKNPEVSVLMSCHNGGRWLHEAIESVLAQTYRYFEFILVDDGSTDETWNIIERYRRQDERIVAICKNNTGLPDSLNVGITRACGTWIARIDADDLCEPTRLAQQITFVRNNPHVVLLGTGFVEIDQRGQTVKRHLYPAGHTQLVRHMERLQRLFPHSSVVFRRAIAQEVGCYNVLFRKAQDLDLWLRLAERGTVACLEKYLVRVRKHDEQISRSASGRPQLAYATVASMCHFLRIDGLADPSTTNNKRIWEALLTWVDRRLLDEGVFERRKAWTDARAGYFAAPNSLQGALMFGIGLLKSQQASALVLEKLYGSAIPQRMAQEWAKKSCAES